MPVVLVLEIPAWWPATRAVRMVDWRGSSHKLPLPFYEESLKNFAVHPASAYAFTTWPVLSSSIVV